MRLPFLLFDARFLLLPTCPPNMEPSFVDRVCGPPVFFVVVFAGPLPFSPPPERLFHKEH